ncbi:hypothetical protein PVAND_006873 [Polypedilum vanderplanki]|uniref:Uncharacterized protein n=1 Tax=Polypedilum vanderplanki TaxID=319348 RepID=A0A9J6C4L9_POLVA|nr:hypothetical protein PVAND_006873 [Polypedilum vanderplanki]
MSKKNKVANLNEMSLLKLANSIISAVSYSITAETIEQNTFLNVHDLDMSLVMVEINSYLEANGATHTIYEELLQSILSSDNLQASVRFVCLQMLLNHNIKSLTTEIFPYPYYEKILQVIVMQGSGIRYLNLKGIWIKEEMMSLMFNIIKNLPYLIKLVIPYIANDDVLHHIMKYQRNLLYLDISGETDITDIGIDYLCTSSVSKTLTCVDIGMLGEENIDHVDIASLLLNISNLTSLGCYSFVGRSLHHILDTINPSFMCKLQYIHDTNTTAHSMRAICKTCPQLRHFYLDSPDANILNLLTTLRKLERLKIYRFNCDEIVPVFKTIGSQFQHLTFMKGRGIMDVIHLIKYCPNLIDLDFYMMDELTINVTYAEGENFGSLQTMEVLNSPMSAITLRHLICNCHQTIRRLAVDNMPFTEIEMASILLEYNFNKLEDIWFTSAPNFTMVTMELLLQLPELMSIGQLSGWRLTPDDIILLKGILRSGNSCLTISPANLFS